VLPRQPSDVPETRRPAHQLAKARQRRLDANRRRRGVRRWIDRRGGVQLHRKPGVAFKIGGDPLPSGSAADTPIMVFAPIVSSASLGTKTATTTRISSKLR
jgi:hypothetical protein